MSSNNNLGPTGPTGSSLCSPATPRPVGPTGPTGDRWQSFTFDLTPTDNANFVLHVHIINNKINNFYVNEHVKSVLFEGVKMQKQPMSAIHSSLPDKIEWSNPPSGDGYTEVAKRVMKEAEEIILRFKEMDIFI